VLAQAAQSFNLVSLWKPLLILLPFVPWALFVSKILDKHAARFILPREKYNTIHLFVGLAAVLAGLAMPMTGIVSLLVGLAVTSVMLLADALIFVRVHNNDDRTPEQHRITLQSIGALSKDKGKKKDDKNAARSALVIKAPDKSVLAVPAAETPEYAVRALAEKVYIAARSARASQVELAPVSASQYAAMMLVDGVPVKGETLPGADAVKVMDLWKTAAKLDLADRRKRQSGDATVEVEERKTKVRVTSMGTQQGMTLTLLFDPEDAVKRGGHELGLLESQMEQIKSLVDEGKGTVILAAPPDGGRTTTMYAITKMHDAYTKNVQTVEREPQATMEGVRQNKHETVADGPEYSTLVRSILRREPDVLAVAELPDAQTAKEISKAEHDRVRTYVSVPAPGALQAAQAWVKLVGDAESASKSLHGVVAQKLVRKLCTKCRVPYAPSADLLKKLGLPPDGVKQLFKKGGKLIVKEKEQECPVCHGAGFLGQEGVFEVYNFNDADRELIRSGDWNGLKLELRKRKIPTMQHAALRKALDGTTSVEEVARVTSETPPAAGGGAGAAGAGAGAGEVQTVRPQAPVKK
jgi:type II secretory ATPase GspE/PulE/Tfp pilus assembly ATPase PilB-like protein